MPRNPTKNPIARDYRSTYTNQDLMNAIDDVRKKRLSMNKASLIYGIPRGTLQNKIRGIHIRNPGHPTVFSEAEEASLVTALVSLSDWGYPLEFFDLRILAKAYLD